MPESRLRAVVDTAVDGIILMDTRGIITIFNPACERIFGYSADEIVGGDVKRLMPAPYRDEHDQYLENYRRTGARKIIGIGREVVGQRKNGQTFPMDLSVGEGQQRGEKFYVGIVRDVSERKRASELRELFIDQLAAAIEERTNFAHVASHDLQEPLRMVTAFCGLLSKDYSDRLDDRGREYLSLALSGAAQMKALLDDLVDFGRLGAASDQGVWFETSRSLDQVLDSLRDQIEKSGAQITRADLPPIFGSPVGFARLLQNLIANALKYVEPGATPRVNVAATLDGALWTFSVADNGIGIDPRHQDRIFEPFKRLHPRTRYTGTGLGLAICRKVVEDFGGRIWVQSSEGEGSTFHFTVKANAEELANDAAHD